MLATPVRGQFEQIMNARYLEYLGYGLQDEMLDELLDKANAAGYDTSALIFVKHDKTP